MTRAGHTVRQNSDPFVCFDEQDEHHHQQQRPRVICVKLNEPLIDRNCVSEKTEDFGIRTEAYCIFPY